MGKHAKPRCGTEGCACGLGPEDVNMRVSRILGQEADPITSGVISHWMELMDRGSICQANAESSWATRQFGILWSKR